MSSPLWTQRRTHSERQQRERRETLRDDISKTFLVAAILRERKLKTQGLQDPGVCLRLAREHRVEGMNPKPARSRIVERRALGHPSNITHQVASDCWTTSRAPWVRASLWPDLVHADE